IHESHIRLYSQEEKLWDSIYLLTINDRITDLQDNSLLENYHFYLLVDGEGSKPPKVVKADLYESIGNTLVGSIYSEEQSRFKSINLDAFTGGPLEGYIDVYFDMSALGEVEYLPFLENFSINANESNVADFNVYHMENLTQINGTSAPYRGSIPAEIDSFEQVVRVYLEINNIDPGTGYITIKLRSNFKDSLGNEISPTWETQFFGANS
ncbi:MAG: hypothetical protein PF447_08485, partial [Spirochaetaceae bacterium]|nr:hypothetical protein [Spirochaetaceae bacterium]